jgi:hypothetical protein
MEAGLRMDKSNRKMLGMLVGFAFGLILGVLFDNIILGLIWGSVMTVPLGKAFAGEELIEDKGTRRRFTLISTLTLVAGCLMYGFAVGDVRSGIGAAIGLSFIIGLKGEKLFDERISNIFSKATRDAFVFANAGFTYVGFFHQLVDVIPFVDRIPIMDRFVYVLVLSWLVFLLSWVYHYYVKGE